MLTITNTGLKAIANAKEFGFRLSITSFAVSEFEPTPTFDDLSMEGIPVYRGDIDTCEALSSAAVKLTVSIPIGVPETGKWVLREIAFFLDTGELFARGKLDPAYDKESHFGIRTFCVAAAARLGDVINISVSKECNVPSVAKVQTLPAAREYPWNVVSVLNMNENPDHSSSSSLVVRYGQGAKDWGFVGHDRVYSGAVEVLTQSSFKLNAAENGFYCRVNEILIASISSGTSYGDSRRVRYLGNDRFVELDGTAFQNLSASSIVSIWRMSTTNRVLPLYTPTLVHHRIDGTGAQTYSLPTTVEQSGFVMPFWNGITFDAEFTVGRSVEQMTDCNLITFENALAVGEFVDLYILVLDSSNVDETGTILVPRTFEFEGDGSTRKFTIPVDITGQEYTIASLSGVRQVFDNYKVGTRYATFNIPPEEGIAVRFTIFERVSRMNNNIEMRLHKKIVTTRKFNVYDPLEDDELGFAFVFMGEQHIANYSNDNKAVYLNTEGEEYISTDILSAGVEINVVEFHPVNRFIHDEYIVEIQKAVKKAGDRMSGPLYLSRNAEDPFEATTKQFVERLFNQIDLTNVVKLTGDQDVAGVKAFSSSPTVPTLALGAKGKSAANADFVNAVVGKAVSELKTLIAGVIPTGVCFAFVGPLDKVPEGYAPLCGGVMNKSDALYGIIGAYVEDYVGNSSQFVLPDARGRVIRGLDNSAGVDIGRILLSLQEDALKKHKHLTYYADIEHSGITYPDGIGGSGKYGPNTPVNEDNVWPYTSEVGDADETRVKNIAMNIIVRVGSSSNIIKAVAD